MEVDASGNTDLINDSSVAFLSGSVQVTAMTAAGANEAFDSLGGLPHAYVPDLAFGAERDFRNVLLDRLADCGCNLYADADGRADAGASLALGSDTPGWTQQVAALYSNALDGSGSGETAQAVNGTRTVKRCAWIRGFGSLDHVKDTSDVTGYNSRSGGIALGADAKVRPHLVAGAALGYVRTDADTTGGTLDMDSYVAALSRNVYYLQGTVGGGLHQTSSSRSVTVGSLATAPTADYGSYDAGAKIEGGRRFVLDAATGLTPLAGLEYAHLWRNGFTESGGGATDLAVNSEGQDSLRSSLGARLDRDFETPDKKCADRHCFKGMAEIAWVHEYMDTESRLTSSFADARTTTFTTVGPDLDRDHARIRLGMTKRIGASSSIALHYQAEFARSDSHHTLALALRTVW